MIERLEDRTLFSIYTVPTGHSLVYLKPVTASPGTVLVILDNPVNPPDATLTDSVSDSFLATRDGVTFHDLVPAVDKPTHGFRFDGVGAGNTTLAITAGPDDTAFDEPNGAAAPAVSVRAFDPIDGAFGSDTFGPGVDNLTILAGADHTDFSIPDLAPTKLTIDTASAAYDTIEISSTITNGQNSDRIVHDARIVTGGAGHDTVNLVSETTLADPEVEYHTAIVDFGDNPGAGNALNVLGLGAIAYLPGTQAIDSVDIQRGTVQLNQGGIGNLTTFGTLSTFGSAC